MNSYVAFTATPVPKTLALFGQPFDVYTEDEAIKEGYILDVAENIVSYKTLYHHLDVGLMKSDEKLYPKGILVKLLNDMAYEDESLIQYKSTVIIDHFEKEGKEMLEGKAKAMVVASTIQAGYIYFLSLNKIIEKKGLKYKTLFAFSDGFTEKVSKQQMNESKVNKLEITDEMPIENYFDKEEYRILIAVNKFQQGFDEPLLCAMYLDKNVNGVNAVQTISRLNRKYPSKNTTAVIDFTNNSKDIFKAFSKYRKGTKVREADPDPSELRDLHIEVMAYNIFSDDMIEQYLETVAEQNDQVFAAMSLIFRTQFEKAITDKGERNIFVNLLLKYVKKFNFFAQFVQLPVELERFALFADLIAGKLIKLGSEKTLKKSLENVTIEKASVKSLGIKKNPNIVKEPKVGKITPPVPPKATIEEVIDDIRNILRIEEGDEIIIKEIYAETMNDEDLIKLIFANRDDNDFLQRIVASKIKQQIIQAYKDKGQILKTREPQYKDEGGIFDLFAENIIRHAKYKAEV
jgi:type I restriction enzyme, R subunit